MRRPNLSLRFPVQWIAIAMVTRCPRLGLSFPIATGAARSRVRCGMVIFAGPIDGYGGEQSEHVLAFGDTGAGCNRGAGQEVFLSSAGLRCLAIGDAGIEGVGVVRR
jgi:hypothetical protein